MSVAEAHPHSNVVRCCRPKLGERLQSHQPGTALLASQQHLVTEWMMMQGEPVELQDYSPAGRLAWVRDDARVAMLL